MDSSFSTACAATLKQAFALSLCTLGAAHAVCVSLDEHWPRPHQPGFHHQSFVEVKANNRSGEVRPGAPYCTPAHNSGTPLSLTIVVFDHDRQKSPGQCEVQIQQDLNTNLIVALGKDGVWGVQGRKHNGNGLGARPFPVGPGLALFQECL